MGQDKIFVKGARIHNLKNIDVTLPRDKLIVVTGLSGSGKSSLVFDTIFAEGQRRFIESLSAYARQFLGQMDKADVEYIEGLSPAISIDQKAASKNPRSTVGTVTEIYDYLRLLFSRVGIQFCYECGRKIERQSVSQIVDLIFDRLEEGVKIEVLGPVVRGRKGEYKDLFDSLKKEGFVRVKVDGEIFSLEEEISLEKYKKHDIEVVVDRVVVKNTEEIRKRLADSVEIALRYGSGLVLIEKKDGERFSFSEEYACPDCGISYDALEPRSFSFNSPFGACTECNGLGFTMEIDPDLIVPDKSKSVSEGCFKPWFNSDTGWYYQILKRLSKHYDFSLDTPFELLSKKHQKVLLQGSDEKIRFSFKGENFSYDTERKFEGIIPNLERRFRETKSDYIRHEIMKYMSKTPCPTCKGRRLRPERLAVRITEKNIHDVSEMSIGEALKFFNELKERLSEREMKIARQILKEINNRLTFLESVGLNYLTLNRASATLSGGESRRIKLATQIGSALVGCIYCLDEPSIGLHMRDNIKLINMLKKLRDQANTVIICEHDRETIEAADFILELGPGSGVNGGYVVTTGSPEDIKKNPKSITGKYLSNELSIPVPKKRKESTGHFLTVRGARQHNLKNIDVSIPLGVFMCITGVSGSGKSTLVHEILYKSLARRFYHSPEKPGDHDKIEGVKYIDKVILVDQSPIGRTPRSCTATYTKVFDHIRTLFASLPESNKRGYKPGRFSFNVRGGRCENCRGNGFIEVEMQFLPSVYVTCDVCKGKRYNRETLEIRYKGKNIADVLKLTVDEAFEFFENIPKIKRILKTLMDVGLGYIQLGQPATTLSGGEAQRIKLSRELSKRSTGQTLYILDEPTTGLHFADVQKLLNVLNRLVDIGNTVVIIEHHPDVIKSADWIVDLGPEGGDDGGRIIAEGAPEEVAMVEKSHTGQYLQKMLVLGNDDLYGQTGVKVKTNAATFKAEEG